MDLLAFDSPQDILNFLTGIGGGACFTWLIIGLFYRFREKRLIRDASALALQRSRRVLKGQAAEQLAPLTQGFPYLPNDSRFLGSPIDYVIFDGLSDEEEVEVVFVEVKSGDSRLSGRESKVRDAIQAGRVRWEELRL